MVPARTPSKKRLILPGSRELGQEGLDEFRTTKHVHWDFSTEPKDFWFPYD